MVAGRVKRPLKPRPVIRHRTVVRAQQRERQRNVSWGRAAAERRDLIRRGRTPPGFVPRARPDYRSPTGGRGPVGTPGGPRRLAGAFALSPAGQRFVRGVVKGPSVAAGGPYRSVNVGSARLLPASADTPSFGITALEQTTRPLHGIAGGVYAGIRGENIPSAVGRGLLNKDRRTFSDVLGAAGVRNKYVRALGGFGLDVVADPTTYLTFGASRVAKVLPRRVAERVEREATDAARAAGATAAETAHAVRVARALALKDVRANRGLTVGLRGVGREVRTSGRATAKVARRVGVTRGGRAVRESRPVQVAGGLMRPDFRPKGVPEAAWARVRRAERTARSIRHAGARASQDAAVSYFRALKNRDQARIIDAVETGQGLPNPKDQVVVEAIRADMAHAHRLEQGLGLVGDPLPNYFPHKLRSKLLPGGKKLPAGKRAQLESSKERKLRDTIEGLRRQGFDEFSDEIPLVVGARLTQSAHAQANAHLIAELNATGRRWGARVPVGDGEWVYEVSRRVPPRKLSGSELKELREAIKTVGPQQAFRGREFRVLNEGLVGHALRAQFPREGAMRAFGAWWDRALQGRFKTLVTVPNPQYHMTNLYGDAFNAYLGDTRLLTSGNAVHSARALRRLYKRDKVRKELGAVLDPSRKGVVIRGKRVRYDELIEEAERVGAVRTGFIGRDLPEVLDAMAKEARQAIGQGRAARALHIGRFTASKAGRVVSHPVQAMRNVSQYREDFVRLATYIEGRKRGLGAAEAAEHVSRYHFDYGDLTDFERTVLRRVFPFYTFTARNAPLQVSRLLQRPGKFATLQKVREEGQKAIDLPQGYEGELTPYQRRQQPIPIPFQIPGVTTGPQNLINLKLPSTDLGRLTPDLTEQQNYVLQMLSPLLSVPLEYPLNFSFFFREPIDKLYQQSEGEVQDYAPAPQWLGDAISATLGEGGLRKLGLYKAPAREGGPTVWVWPKRVNYLYGHLGPAAGTAQRLGNPAENQAGQGSAESLFGFATGIKVWPYDPKKLGKDAAYRERDRLDARAQLYRRRGLDRDRSGAIRPGYRRLLDRLNRLNKRLQSQPSSGGSGWGSAAPVGGGGWGSAGN